MIAKDSGRAKYCASRWPLPSAHQVHNTTCTVPSTSVLYHQGTHPPTVLPFDSITANMSPTNMLVSKTWLTPRPRESCYLRGAHLEHSHPDSWSIPDQPLICSQLRFAVWHAENISAPACALLHHIILHLDVEAILRASSSETWQIFASFSSLAGQQDMHSGCQNLPILSSSMYFRTGCKKPGYQA